MLRQRGTKNLAIKRGIFGQTDPQLSLNKKKNPTQLQPVSSLQKKKTPKATILHLPEYQVFLLSWQLRTCPPPELRYESPTTTFKDKPPQKPVQAAARTGPRYNETAC